MTKKIQEIQGIGAAYAEKLANAGITNVDHLLTKGATRPGRKAIAEASGIDEAKVLDFVNMADLFRIKGVAGQFAELLKASGVDTVKELRNRNPENLHERLATTNREKKLTRVVPSVSQVSSFINQAKSLPPQVKY